MPEEGWMLDSDDKMTSGVCLVPRRRFAQALMEGRLYHNVLSYNNALVIEVARTCKLQK
jgi:hypothetical protein